MNGKENGSKAAELNYEQFTGLMSMPEEEARELIRKMEVQRLILAWKEEKHAYELKPEKDRDAR